MFPNDYLFGKWLIFTVIKTKRGTENMEIWNAPEKNPFMTMMAMRSYEAMGFLLVYNINDKDSFKFIIMVNDMFSPYRDKGKMVTVAANHVDDSQPRQISIEEGWNYANSKGYQYFEVSSMTGDNIEECLVSLVDPQPIKPLSSFFVEKGRETYKQKYEESKQEAVQMKLQIEELKQRIKEVEIQRELNTQESQHQSQHQRMGRQIKIMSEEDLQNYEDTEEIGDGESSKVFLTTKKKFFAKKIFRQREFDIKKLQHFYGEYEILNQMRHPNIIKTYGFCYGDKDHEPSMILGYCPKNLKAEIQNMNKVAQICAIYQIIEAMKYIHLNNIIHRDLKPENILIDSKGRIKICDFGISTLFSEKTLSTGIGTLRFMAPELINESKHYTEKVDIYSFGIILCFIMMEGKLPDMSVGDVAQGKEWPIPSSIHPNCSKIIVKCLSSDPEDRPSFEEISKEIRKMKFEIEELSTDEKSVIQTFVEKHDDLIGYYINI